MGVRVEVSQQSFGPDGSCRIWLKVDRHQSSGEERTPD
jgi:hypothetical protein